MLGELLSGDEDVFEEGEGLKGKDTDEALSGIKLYKGETLLELTERWKLLQNKMYNEEKDTFDLSRVPDVHDVREYTSVSCKLFFFITLSSPRIFCCHFESRMFDLTCCIIRT